MKQLIFLLCWLCYCLHLPGQSIPVLNGKITDTSHQLRAVVVKSSKPYIEQGIDRTIVHVDAQISNTGTNTLEVLEKTPGVVVDEDGNISLKGKTGVLVLIDDKPTYLSAADLAAYLKSLPSSAIDKIELMDNPPARYDAAGNAGVINIRTKKSATRGFNSSVTGSYNQGIYWRYSGSVNMNYRSGKVNLFANLGTYDDKRERVLDVTRDYFDAGGNPLSSFTQSNYFVPVSHNGNAKLGMDYNSSAHTTWGVVLNGSLSDYHEWRPNYNYLYNAAHQLDSSVVAANTASSLSRRGNANLNYSHRFDTLGTLVTVDLDYSRFDSHNDPSFLYHTYDPNGVLLDTQQINGHTPSVIDIYSAKTDWSFPLSSSSKLEAGLKSSYVSTDNTASYYNILNGHSYIDNTTTNRFLYHENINAGYLNYNRKLSRLSIQLGLRVENTNGFGHQLGNAVASDSAFEKHYTSLFPTAYFSYKLDSAGVHTLNLSFGRRIGRPYYQDLNPFVFFQNKYTWFAGNPYLLPQFNNTYKISYQYRSLLTVGLMYDHATDLQTEVIHQSGNVFISSTGNIGERSYLGFSTNLALKPVKWWSFNLYTELNHAEYKGYLPDSYLNVVTTYFYSNASTQFSFGRGWSGELSGMYLSSQLFAQFKKVPYYQVNAGLQKKVWRDKGSIKLGVRDIFHTYASSGEITNVPNAIISFHNVLDTRVASLSFTYNFGKQFEMREKRNDNNEEVNRVKN
ncbi:TonB-dependent receptor plug [Russula earlei]|uniref:TonB-dependent receptor plug n=1 Tax=Russula earlei TaxID=71964 RepID=A0ACC0TWG8_9AGAM|nr:TonB-dependent receptor plug [Russula earlei]